MDALRMKAVGLCGGVALGLAVVLTPPAAFADIEALFAPRADLWDRWTAHEPAATATIDHAPWQRFLDAYLAQHAGGVNRLGYDRVTAQDRTALAAYIDGLAALPITRYPRAEQQAYWVNLYNALTVRVVLDHMPVASILDIDISPGFFADGPWGKKLVIIEGEAVSLDDIEHRILRPIWRDPRIHYAVNCASIGCPNLQGEAFTAANAERLLQAGARDYVNHPRGARVDGDGLEVSSIYVWFQEDFGGDEAGVIAHLRRHAEAGLKEKLAGIRAINGHDYDWALNR